ncbi:hypothetical protein, partial [Synechococcus sp. 1G10]|uniref:hypothetical protein n=1 Tax=Synechococcus sp. 1G10 TaxID=2025605 RepID=UPI001E4C4E0D
GSFDAVCGFAALHPKSHAAPLIWRFQRIYCICMAAFWQVKLIFRGALLETGRFALVMALES